MKKKSSIDETQIESLFKESYSLLCLVSFNIIQDQEAAKDIVQDFFISYWQKREVLPTIKYFKAYSIKAIKNLSIQHLNKSKKEKSLIESLNIKAYSEQKPIDKPNDDSIIIKAHELLDRLPESRRNIFKSFVLDGKSYSEIAENNGISINTVKTQMKRAYAYLRFHAKEDLLHILIVTTSLLF